MPVPGNLGPDPSDANAVHAFEQLANQEDPGLPNPYMIDPEPLFAWFGDTTLEEVEIRPRNAQPQVLRTHRAVVEALGLNREELRQARYHVFRPTMLMGRFLLKARATPGLFGPAETQELIETLAARMSARSPFAGMVRWLVNTELGLNLQPTT